MEKTPAVRICCTSVLAGSTAARDAASWLTLPMNMSVIFRLLQMESKLLHLMCSGGELVLMLRRMGGFGLLSMIVICIMH